MNVSDKTLTVTKYDTITNLPSDIPLFKCNFDEVLYFDPEQPSLPLNPLEQEENEDIIPVHEVFFLYK